MRSTRIFCVCCALNWCFCQSLLGLHYVGIFYRGFVLKQQGSSVQFRLGTVFSWLGTDLTTYLLCTLTSFHWWLSMQIHGRQSAAALTQVSNYRSVRLVLMMTLYAFPSFKIHWTLCNKIHIFCINKKLWSFDLLWGYSKVSKIAQLSNFFQVVSRKVIELLGSYCRCFWANLRLRPFFVKRSSIFN